MVRIRLDLISGGDSGLTVHYRYLVQSMIYSYVSRDLSRFLHDYGFQYGKRRFKLFTFSELIGRHRLDRLEKKIYFDGFLHLYISSPLDRFINELGTTILKKGYVEIGETIFKVRDIRVMGRVEFNNEHVIKTLSPITIYSTLYTPDGARKTYYYSPYEDEFSKLASSNALKKYRTLYKKDINGYIELKPIKVKEKVLKYKGIIIKGWIGKYIIRGNPELIRIVYEAGVGPKNSAGFGMFEVIE